MRLIAAIVLSLLPAVAIAAGSDDNSAPKPTQTSTDCTKSQVWDDKTKTCIDATSGQLDDDTLFRAVRELAWAGRPEDALVVLSAMKEGETDRVMTYLGFANRKAGRLEEGLAWYDRALAQNPDNLLARSYLGQAYVEMNEVELASLQLSEIRSRGGSGTWSEASLATAIETGKTLAY
jgi:tetratricopeptide (TPR) repeat protein